VLIHQMVQDIINKVYDEDDNSSQEPLYANTMTDEPVYENTEFSNTKTSITNGGVVNPALISPSEDGRIITLMFD